MKILVMDLTAKVFPLECESTDTIAHLKAKLKNIAGISLHHIGLMLDGKQLGDQLSENMILADVGIQDGSLILLRDLSLKNVILPCFKLCSPLLRFLSLVCFSSTDIYTSELSTMKILVMDETAKIFSFECKSTDTIAHLKAKLKKIAGISLHHLDVMFDGKQLGGQFSKNMTLADVGVQDGSLALIYDTSLKRGHHPPRIPKNDYLYYADAFKSGWREEHAKALLHLFLELCQDGTISEGNVTYEAWLRIQNSLNNSMKCSFQIDFLKERLRDYEQLYSILTETNSPIFYWDCERKTILIKYNWREEYPELLLLCRPYIPYFDTLEEVCLLLNTTQCSEQRVHETSTNINNAWETSSSRGEICIRDPSDSNLSSMGSSMLIGKENRYLRSTMKILVVDMNAKVFSLECDSTDTVAHLKAKLEKIETTEFRFQSLMFDGKLLGDEFSENMTLADVGVQDGSFILQWIPRKVVLAPGLLERPPPKNNYLYYADIFKSGWTQEHAKALLHLLLKLCQDGTISECNVTDDAWIRIQNRLNNSMKCSFQINFLKERLHDYMQLYSVLTDPTISWSINLDRERKTINVKDDDWRKKYPELLLLSGNYIPYFDTLENVCSLLNTGQSSRRESQSPVLSKFKSLFGKSQQS